MYRIHFPFSHLRLMKMENNLNARFETERLTTIWNRTDDVSENQKYCYLIFLSLYEDWRKSEKEINEDIDDIPLL